MPTSARNRFVIVLGLAAALAASAVSVRARTRSLYDRIGGEAALKAVIDDFVALTAAHPKVNFTKIAALTAPDVVEVC